MSAPNGKKKDTPSVEADSPFSRGGRSVGRASSVAKKKIKKVRSEETLRSDQPTTKAAGLNDDCPRLPGARNSKEKILPERSKAQITPTSSKEKQKREKKMVVVESISLKKNNQQVAREWAAQVMEKGVEKIKAEFRPTQAEPPSPDVCKGFLANPSANRYPNMECLDSTRVKLTNGDYIHANFVGTPSNPTRFICAQAPLPNTCLQFWNMILQHECEVVVMLCDFTEKNTEKSAAYIPTKEGETKKFGNITIAFDGSMELPDTLPSVSVTVRFLLISRPSSDTPFLLRHFQWNHWPDHGVPSSFIAPTKLLGAVRKTKKPLIVHCSAGVGRTGTLVTMALSLDVMAAGQPFEGVLNILEKIRTQRAHSVQNDIQYLYIHRCLLEYLNGKGILKYMPVHDLEKFNKELETALLTTDKRRRKKSINITSKEEVV